MMTTRQSALYALVLGTLTLAALTGCSAGNPYMSSAESAMQSQNYERALANVDTAITQDSANVEAYLMRARILRQMADSTTPPNRYKELYQRAREAEQMAIKFAPGRRSEVETQRRLAYIQEFQKGAQQFNRARKAQTRDAYQRAAAYFGAAGSIRPDSTGPVLNEAYARLNAAQLAEGEEMEQGMKEVIPILERYLNMTEEPNKNAYTILTQLYLQEKRPRAVIELTKRAIDDLSNRPTYFRIAGANGLNYTGSVDVGGTSRSVKGTVPDRVQISASDGMVSGSFQKSQPKGTMRVSLFYQGTQLGSDQITAPSDTATVSHDLSGLTPLAQLQNYRLNALNQTGNTEEAMSLYQQQIEEHPENATYRYNYGSLLLNADRFEEAIPQLQKAVELDPDDPKKQYNLGAAYVNKGAVLQDSLVTLRDTVLAQNREPTEEESSRLTELNKSRMEFFTKAIPPLERARQLSGPGGQYYQDACSALFQAYVQTEQKEKADEVQKCMGQDMGEQGTGNGEGDTGSGGSGR